MYIKEMYNKIKLKTTMPISQFYIQHTTSIGLGNANKLNSILYTYVLI